MKSLRSVLWPYALPAIAFALLPATHDVLLYDRAAIFRGELWRLWTGHWIHFSWSHLGWNLAVLLMAGAWLEHLRPGLLVRYTFLAAPLISAVLLFLAPDMSYYGGLSGLATGVVTLLACAHLFAKSPNRTLALTVLVLVAIKICLDANRTTPLLSQFSTSEILTSAHAHTAGAAAALLSLLAQKSIRQALPLRQPYLDSPQKVEAA